MGSAPFVFGPKNEYSVNMANPEAPFNKKQYFEMRTELFKSMRSEQVSLWESLIKTHVKV
jgi:hypothetical protein